MARHSFTTADGPDVTAVTAEEMRAVDRVAVEEIGLQLLQMMENAGRALAWHVRDVRDVHEGERVAVLAGNGGNGGGGMACARHLANRGVPVRVVLDRSPGELTGAAARQHRVLEEMDVPTGGGIEGCSRSGDPTVVVDALVGYGLSGEVRQPAEGYIRSINRRSDPTVSLDVPSGIDATTGETRGVAVTPDRTVTLALPKTGLDAVAGRLFLADIGIPATVYERLDVEYGPPFADRDWVELVP